MLPVIQAVNGANCRDHENRRQKEDAQRIESQTKVTGTPLLITEATYNSISGLIDERVSEIFGAILKAAGCDFIDPKQSKVLWEDIKDRYRCLTT